PTVALDALIEGRAEATNLAAQIQRWRAEPAAGRAFAVHVRGPSGVGKTRLTHALATHLGLPVIEVDAAVIASLDARTAAEHVDALFQATEFLDALLVIDQVDVWLGGHASLAALRRNL